MQAEFPVDIFDNLNQCLAPKYPKQTTEADTLSILLAWFHYILRMVWGVIAAVVSAQLIGALFYSPFFLGNPWMKATFPGRSRDSIGSQAGSAYAVTLVASSATALFLHFILINFFHVKMVLEAVKFAGGLGVLCALIDIPHMAFSQRSLVAYLIDHAFDVVTLVSMAAWIFYFS